MSEALKCDRCKRFFDYNSSKYNCISFGCKTTLLGFRGFPKDICPSCMEQFKKWYENPDTDDTDCTDRSNGATDKELELASKLNDAKIYIAQLKSELGYTMTKEEIEINSKLNEYGCSHDKCWKCPHFFKEPNPFNIHDHNGIYKCNFKNVYISGNCSRPNASNMTPADFCKLGCDFVKENTEDPGYKDPCKSCHNAHCEQCDYGYCSEEEKKKRWVERHKEEVKLSDPYEDGGL